MADLATLFNIDVTTIPAWAMDITDPPPPVLWFPDSMLGIRGVWRANDLAGGEGSLIATLPSFGGVLTNTLTAPALDSKKPLIGLKYGKKSVLFDGVDDYIFGGDESVTNDAESTYWFGLVEFVAIPGDNQLKFLMYDDNNTGSGRRSGIVLSNAVSNKKLGYTYKIPDNGATVLNYTGVTMPVGVPCLVFMRMIISGSGSPLIEIRMHGAVIGTFTPTFGATKFSNTNSARNVYGGLYENINASQVNAHYFLFGRGRGVPPLSDIEKTEGCAYHFIGRQDLLPNGHPYRYAPPYIETP